MSKATPSVDIYDDGDYKKDVPKSKQTNCLLMRRPLGRGKPTTYALPGPSFVYGKVERPDSDNNCLAWSTDPSPSASATSSDTVGVSRSVLMAKKVQVPYKPDTVFGKPSPPTTSLTSVVTNQYQREWLQQQKEVREAAQVKSAPSKGLQGGLKPAAPTAASKGHTRSKEVVAEPVPFKMKQFQNIPSRVRLQNLSHLGKTGSAAPESVESAPAAAAESVAV